MSDDIELQLQSRSSNGQRFEGNSAGDHAGQHMGNSGYHNSHNTYNNYTSPNNTSHAPRRRMSYRRAPTDPDTEQNHRGPCEKLLQLRIFWFVAALLAAVIILAIVLSATLTQDSRSSKEG